MKQDSMNKPPAPQMKATYWGPGTAAQYAAGSAGLHWPHQEKLPLALFFSPLYMFLLCLKLTNL